MARRWLYQGSTRDYKATVTKYVSPESQLKFIVALPSGAMVEASDDEISR